MTRFEIPTPLINNPLDEPQKYWHIIVEGEPAELRDVKAAINSAVEKLQL